MRSFRRRVLTRGASPCATIATLAILLASGPHCATLTPEEKEALRKRDLAREVDDEVTVGRQISARLLGTLGHYKDDKAVLEYVNLVGQTLARQSGRPELRFHFAILKTDEINAYATPGGFIFVTRGLLKMVRSESELAGILGHEIAHINEKHMYTEIMPKREISTSEALVRFMSKGKSDVSGSLSQIVGSGMKLLLEKGLGKEKEHAADQAGTLYAAAAGYDPTALHGFLRRLHQDRSSVKISKTHPPFPERLSSLQGFLEKNGLQGRSAADGAVMESRFRAAMAGVQRGT